MRARNFFWILILSMIFSSAVVVAEEGTSAVRDFSITPSGEWMELPLGFQNVVASYGKQGTLATFYVAVRDLEDAKKVQDLKWEDLFSPQYESIDIRSQGETTIGGEKTRYCVYSLKPGPFKMQMEGKLPAKYMNYVLVHNNQLFSITFKDTEDGFAINYPSFVAAIRTLRFGSAAGNDQKTLQFRTVVESKTERTSL